MAHGRTGARCVLTAALVLAACSSHPATPRVADGASPQPTAARPAGAGGRPAWSVRSENALPGTPGWQLKRVGTSHEIEGWADRTSVLAGHPLGLHVSTTAPAYTVSAIRVGWYGGTLGRQVWRSATVRGVARDQGQIVSSTHTLVTSWPASLALPTASWPPGDYLLRLDASTGAQRYVPLQVRRPNLARQTVVVSSDTTWQAYNAYGGYSLYHGPDGATRSRARVVSFDRPYGIETGQGASEYMENMRPLVSLVEQLGIDAAYVSDVDLHEQPHLLDGARAVLLTGHDEYWSAAMRSALLRARDAGTNLAFFGANSGYRHIRLEPQGTAAGRLEVCYKEPTEDPLYGRDNADVTGQWRYPPDPRPESVLTGVFYQSNPVHADLVVVNPGSWLLAGTHTRVGSVLPGVVAPEFDRVDLSVPTPRPIEILTHSPLVVNGKPDFADSAYYTVPSGAAVFASGSIAWINSLQGGGGPQSTVFTTTVTSTVLRAFAAGPSGRAHPAHDNVSQFYP